MRKMLFTVLIIRIMSIEIITSYYFCNHIRKEIKHESNLRLRGFLSRKEQQVAKLQNEEV